MEEEEDEEEEVRDCVAFVALVKQPLEAKQGEECEELLLLPTVQYVRAVLICYRTPRVAKPDEMVGPGIWIPSPVGQRDIRQGGFGERNFGVFLVQGVRIPYCRRTSVGGTWTRAP
jgi:hypothetical protein